MRQLLAASIEFARAIRAANTLAFDCITGSFGTFEFSGEWDLARPVDPDAGADLVDTTLDELRDVAGVEGSMPPARFTAEGGFTLN